jgi:hypothetical protein
MAAAAFWALTYSFELMAPSLTGQVFWVKVQYAGVAEPLEPVLRRMRPQAR